MNLHIPTSRIRTAAVVTTLLSIALFAGCDGATVHQIATIRDNGRFRQLDVPIEARFGGRAAQRGLGAQGVADLLEWKAPDGWDVLPPRPLRNVNLKKGDVQCYVSFLTGGGAMGNINRWRMQMGEQPVSRAAIDELKTARILGRDAWLLDLTGRYQGMDGIPHPSYRMVAGYVEFPAFALSIKMFGPAEQVAAERKAFDAFTASLGFDMHRGFGTGSGKRDAEAASQAARNKAQADADPHRGAPSGASNGAPPGTAFDPHALQWSLPANWTPRKGSGMRFVSFDIARGTEAYILFLPMDGGGVIANINRWREQMKQAPLTKKQIDDLERVRILGVESPVLEAYSPDRKGLIATHAAVPGQTMFIKMIGPADRVRAAKDAFFAFCASLRTE